MNKHDWSDLLHEYVAECRREMPIPDRRTLSPEEEWQCRVIGGTFMAWRDRHSLGDIRLRKAFRPMINFDPKPLVIFTTSMPGLVAGQEIVTRPSKLFVMLRQREFETWNMVHSMGISTFHVQHWNYFKPLTPKMQAKAQAAYPDVDTDSFRAHAEGHLWGEQCGVGGVHLWKRTGNKMQLLEEAFIRAVC